jgi:23S rRNA (adenine2503-C2)-methyltransferase
MPITRKYHLSDLIDACRAYPLRPWEKLTFEYVLLKGVNDYRRRRPARMREAPGVNQTHAKMNLIALNQGRAFRSRRPTPHAWPFRHRPALDAVLHPQAPRPGRLRACGQLKRTENAK